MRVIIFVGTAIMEMSMQNKLRIDCKRCATPLIILMVLYQYGQAGMNLSKMQQHLIRDGQNKDMFTTNHLYNVLFNLEAEGLVCTKIGPGKQGSTCKYYKLTDKANMEIWELVGVYQETDALFHYFLSVIQEKEEKSEKA